MEIYLLLYTTNNVKMLLPAFVEVRLTRAIVMQQVGVGKATFLYTMSVQSDFPVGEV